MHIYIRRHLRVYHRPRIKTSSQLIWWLNWKSTAPVSAEEVRIPVQAFLDCLSSAVKKLRGAYTFISIRSSNTWHSCISSYTYKELVYDVIPLNRICLNTNLNKVVFITVANISTLQQRRFLFFSALLWSTYLSVQSNYFNQYCNSNEKVYMRK